MDDIAGILAGMLSGGGAGGIGDLAASLGLGQPGAGIGDILSALGAVSGGDEPEAGAENGGESPSFDPTLLLNVGRAVSAMKAQDKNVELIMALKPHLSGRRREKADEAIKLLRLLRLLPLLNESGFLKGILG